MARTRGVAQLLLLQLVVSFRPDAAPRRPLPARALRGERDDTTAASAKLIEKFISSRPADPAAASRSRRFRFRASARAKTAARDDELHDAAARQLHLARRALRRAHGRRL